MRVIVFMLFIVAAVPDSAAAQATPHAAGAVRSGHQPVTVGEGATVATFVRMPVGVRVAIDQHVWEFALGAHAIRRQDSSTSPPDVTSYFTKTHAGGGFTVARRIGKFAGVAEAGVTRRAGHNDWHGLLGARVRIVDGTRASVFVQGLAGTVIRRGAGGWAVQPGLGVDLRWTERLALRLEIDAPIDRVDGRTVPGGRAAVALVFR